MKKLRMLAAGLLLVPTLAFAVTPVAQAQSFGLRGGTEAAKGDGAADGFRDPNETVRNFVNIFLWIVGILSVIMLIWGGVRYITSAGDSNKVTAAKNTIMYAVIGLVIAILAYAIANFVISQVGAN